MYTIIAKCAKLTRSEAELRRIGLVEDNDEFVVVVEHRQMKIERMEMCRGKWYGYKRCVCS